MSNSFKSRLNEVVQRFENMPSDEAIHMLSTLYLEANDNAQASAAMHKEARLLAVKYWEAIQRAPHDEDCWYIRECDCWKAKYV